MLIAFLAHPNHAEMNVEESILITKVLGMILLAGLFWFFAATRADNS